MTTPMPAHAARNYLWVLGAIVAGGLVGHFAPALGEALNPLGLAFIKLVKMVIGPVIFLTVVTGIAGMGELRGLGAVTAKAMGYFLVVSSFALVIGLVVANTVQPGVGMNVDPATLDGSAIARFTDAAHDQSITAFLLDIIPGTLVGAFTDGDILPVLFVSVLFGVAAVLAGERARPLLDVLESASTVVFRLSLIHI